MIGVASCQIWEDEVSLEFPVTIDEATTVSSCTETVVESLTLRASGVRCERGFSLPLTQEHTV
jgi:hypothetical protein